MIHRCLSTNLIFFRETDAVMHQSRRCAEISESFLDDMMRFCISMPKKSRTSIREEANNDLWI